MTHEQKNIKSQPYVGMQVFIKRENCTYAVTRVSDKKVYISPINITGNETCYFVNSRKTTKRFKMFADFQEMLDLGMWVIIEA